MAAGKTEFPWGAATGVALAIMLGLAAFFRGGLDHPSVTRLESIGVSNPVSIGEIAEIGASDAAQAELFLQDPTPLFLPTRFNSGQVDSTMTAETSPGTSFGSIPAKFVYPTEGNRLDLPDVVAVPESALTAVRAVESPLEVEELARGDASLTSLTSRLGQLEVRSVADGTLLWEVELPESANGVMIDGPVELLVAIESGGQISQPGLIRAWTELGMDLPDLQNVLETVRLGARLRPGIYRILLGP